MIATLAMVCLTALADPGADLQRLALSGQAQPQVVADALESGLAELQGQTRSQQCMDRFLAGELYRKAAAASPGLGYEQQAIEAFRAMRVDYMDLPTGALGYIGEARVHLQNGDAEQSLSALAPLLDPPGVTRIKRLAELESLEALLLIEPGRAISQARQYGEPAHWFLARALAKQGERENALELARSGSVVASAPHYQRLKLIADLDALEDAERSAWAQALARVGRNDEALAVLHAHAPTESLSLYAALLQQAGDKQAAATQWHKAIQHGAGPKAQLAYAACLASMIADDPSRKPAALRAYRQLIESDAEDALRRDALRRWVHLTGPDGLLDMLSAHSDLVGADPYLRYARVAARRDTSDPQSLIPELTEVARDAQDPVLRAAAILLHAQIHPDAREALSLLEQHWAELTTQPTLVGPARERRVGLWLELGMTDHAVEKILADPDATSAELLQVAGALADRYADGMTPRTRERVIRLTSEALKVSPDDEHTALIAGKVLLRVEAHTDAVKVLRSLTLNEAKPLLAESLRAAEHPQESIDALGDLQTPDASLQRGLSLLALNEPKKALIHIRQARNASRAGSDFWWDATLALVAVQLKMNDRLAADEVLRVSEALYPVTTRPRLRLKLQAIKKELQ